MKKKSQTEIMGLAIIVILLSLGMLFAVNIMLKKPADIKKSFTQKELASNTVNTLLATNTGCKGMSVSQILKDCSEDPLGECTPGNSYCAFAESTIKEILEKTLVKWNKKYYFTVKVKDLGQLTNVVPPSGKLCAGEKITSSPCCVLPTQLGPMTINLDICG